MQEGEYRVQETNFFVGDQAQKTGHSKRSPRESAEYDSRPKFLTGLRWQRDASAQGLPEPNDGERQRSGEKEGQTFSQVIIRAVGAIEDGQRLDDIEIEEPERRKGPLVVIESIGEDRRCDHDSTDRVSRWPVREDSRQSNVEETWVSGCRSTYPHREISRIRKYRCRFEACHNVGSDRASQTMALVGRRTQARAARSSERRKLQKMDQCRR